MSGPASTAQLRMLFALCDELGVDRDDRLKVIEQAIAADGADELSVDAASALIRSLEDKLYADNPQRMFEAAHVAKARKRHDLLAALGQPPSE